jgi:hypothetical protein
MNCSAQSLKFEGMLLQRGFWLYIWEITVATEEKYYYVGRTGDSSSANAQSPFNRMGQHLGFNKNSNVLRRHLKSRGNDPENCTFHLVAYGPIVDEAKTDDEHRKNRDIVAGLEKKLADAMRTAGYEVLNTVYCRKELDVRLFNDTRNAFASYFPKLRDLVG